jgi:hypothetical protein
MSIKPTETTVEDLSVQSLRYLAGVKQSLEECGIPMMTGMPEHRPPASFSINATAADGQEVSSMLRDIMNLAGVSHADHSPAISAEPGHADHGASEPMTMEPEKTDGADIMRSTMDKLNAVDQIADADGQPEDEGWKAGAVGAGLGALAGGPIGAAIGGGLGGSMEDESMGNGGTETMQSMADEIRSMADKLADIDSKEELGLESYDNTPNSPTDVPLADTNKFAYQPNNTEVGNRMDGNMPRGNVTFEDQLMHEYKKFVSEAEEKTMSRAAKGMMKYGKEGMKALAKAGKDGKDLDKVRDKYNKYDESAKWRDPKHKDKLYTQEPRGDDDDYYSDDDYYNPKPDDYPGAKNLKGGGEFDNNDPLGMRHDISRNSDDPEMWGYGTISSKGKRKGLPTRSVVNRLKDKIKQHQGAHPRPNLPR